MVNKFDTSRSSRELARMKLTIGVYVIVVIATVALLAVLSVLDPGQAGEAAWIHMIIVAAFAVLLPLRVRSAAAGNVGGLRAVGLISAALLLVNVVEALLPALFPVWMRIEMIGIAALMAIVILLVVRIRLSSHSDDARSAGR